MLFECVTVTWEANFSIDKMAPNMLADSHYNKINWTNSMCINLISHNDTRQTQINSDIPNYTAIAYWLYCVIETLLKRTKDIDCSSNRLIMFVVLFIVWLSCLCLVNTFAPKIRKYHNEMTKSWTQQHLGFSLNKDNFVHTHLIFNLFAAWTVFAWAHMHGPINLLHTKESIE